MQTLFRAGLCSVLLACAACGSSPSLYEWGDYQGSVYALTTADVDIGAEIDSIQTTLKRGVDRGKPAAPGMHAHLGYLYLVSDDPDNATAAFETEKELYPESAVFIDGLMERLGANR